MSLTRATLLAAIRRNASALEATNRKSEELYAERLKLFQEGRSSEPVITNAEMAEAAGISEVAVIQAVRVARLKAEGKRRDGSPVG